MENIIVFQLAPMQEQKCKFLNKSMTMSFCTTRKSDFFSLFT